MNVVEFLFERRAPESHVALLDRKGATTYGELRAAICRIAAHLRGLKIRPGERCAILSENSRFWVAAYLGAIHGGYVAVPLPPNAPAEDCAAMVQATSPRAAMVQARLLPRYAAALAPVAALVVDGRVDEALTADRQVAPAAGICRATRPETSPAFADFDDRTFLAALMFTSGSSGAPRAAMITHRNIVANTSSILEYLPLGLGDRMMDVLPLCYCFGASLLHTHLRAGGSLAMDNRFMFPDRVLANLQETGCTGFAGVPANYQILLRKSSFPRMQFPSLRHVQQAGGKLPEPFLHELRRALPRVDVFVMYGQTEATARLAYLAPERLAAKPDSIGRAIPGVRLDVLDAGGWPAPPGAVGEIVAAGENIAAGYWNAPAETARVFRNGRLYTGDLATRDADGDLRIVGREREFLKLGGYRVGCQQLENAIAGFPGLVEAAVVPVPDDLQGEAVVLFAVHPAGEAVAHELRAFCARHLPVHQRPKKIVIRQDLPHNAAGKVDRARLKKEGDRL